MDALDFDTRIRVARYPKKNTGTVVDMSVCTENEKRGKGRRGANSDPLRPRESDFDHKTFFFQNTLSVSLFASIHSSYSPTLCESNFCFETYFWRKMEATLFGQENSGVWHGPSLQREFLTFSCCLRFKNAFK